MKRYLIPFALCFLFCICSINAQQNSVTLITATRGIAPVASFGLSEPATLVFADMKVWRNLHFMPDIAFSLKDGDGWFADTWVKWVQPIDTAGKWSITLGVDWAPFFQPYGTNGATVTQMVRYAVFEVAGKFVPDTTQSVSLVYWYNHVINPNEGVRGHFVSLAYAKTFSLSKSFSASGTLNPYWVSFSDGANGTSVSGALSMMHKKSGLFLATQGVLPFSKSAGESNYNFSLGIYRAF